MNELIIDSFAGGGRAAYGIEVAAGGSTDNAINHDSVHKTARQTYSAAFVKRAVAEIKQSSVRSVAAKHNVPCSTVKAWKRRYIGKTRAPASEAVLRIVFEEAPITARGVAIALDRTPRHARQVLSQLKADGAVLRSKHPIPQFKPSLRTKRAFDTDQSRLRQQA